MAQRILILTKDTTLLRELEQGFGRYGAAVEIVKDGKACVARAKAQPTALVMVDADALPPGEALLVCRNFKADGVLAKIPFVLMGESRYAEIFAAHKKLHRRADDYLQLPLAFDDLVAKLAPLVPFGGERAEGESP